jgi:hypothetical protein
MFGFDLMPLNATGTVFFSVLHAIVSIAYIATLWPINALKL